MLMTSNVHERAYPVPARRLGELLDSLAGPDDRLWPAHWPPMVLDTALGVGARGGHGPIRYSVTGYEPGRRAAFRFDRSTGFTGSHELTVLDGATPGTALLRHVLIAHSRGLRRLRWTLVVRRLHDALLEDLLDRAAREVGHPPARPARWSPSVRLARRLLLAGPPRVAAGPGGRQPIGG